MKDLLLYTKLFSITGEASLDEVFIACWCYLDKFQMMVTLFVETYFECDKKLFGIRA